MKRIHNIFTHVQFLELCVVDFNHAAMKMILRLHSTLIANQINIHAYHGII